jgi:hypothetical protein
MTSGEALFAERETGESAMKTRIGRKILGSLLAVTVPLAMAAADEIKGGRWQFTTEMQIPSAAAPAGQSGGREMTSSACIDVNNPVPVEPQQGGVLCKIDEVRRNGGVVTWSMTCSSPQGPIHSAGAARYSGDTMEATLTARIPGPNGQPTDAPGRVTGRYVGPCNAK